MPEIKQKVEILNFKDTTSQKRFCDITSKTSVFNECVESVDNVSEQAQSWLRLVKTHC